MARLALTQQALNRTGLTTSQSSIVVLDGFSIPYDSTLRTFVRIKNATGGDATVTAAIVTTVDGVAVVGGGKTLTVPATTGDKMWGPFTADYKQADSKVYFSTDVVVTVACVQLASS